LLRNFDENYLNVKQNYYQQYVELFEEQFDKIVHVIVFVNNLMFHLNVIRLLMIVIKHQDKDLELDDVYQLIYIYQV
jgi:hypothetical protein